jgi:hypothetical protein
MSKASKDQGARQGFLVQRKSCATCIYRKDSPLDLKALEAAVADKYGGFSGHRICHHSSDACCRGFWNRHKDEFQMGQVAQRLGMVTFVDDATGRAGFEATSHS